MFQQLSSEPKPDTPSNSVSDTKTVNKLPYIPNYSQQHQTHSMESNQTVNIGSLDILLEKEKNFNKTDSWNKLDKTSKMQKLHGFAEKYGREQNLSSKEIKALKLFFVECLEKGKLQKTKDVVYNKEDREIVSIPALFFNVDKKCFTLRISNKRVSTLKSLTPKRTTAREIAEKENDEDILHDGV